MVASRDLHVGVTLNADDLYALEMPPRLLPEGVFLTPEHVIGHVPRERILANELVRASRLASPDGGTGLNALIPRGMRAVSVNIRDGQALSGFLHPGDYVDVLVTVAPERGDKPSTHTLLQAAYVLGVNSRLGSETHEEATKRGRHQPSVTLLTTESQSRTVAHAANQGEVRLVLRNSADYQEVSLTGADMSDLLPHIEAPSIPRVQPVAEAPKGLIWVLRGSHLSLYETDEKPGRLLD